MSHQRARKPKPAPTPPAAVTVRLPLALLDAARGACPQARDWTDTQVAAGCVALAVRLALPASSTPSERMR